MPTKSRTSKRKLQPEPPSRILSKRLRSNLPRRRRRQISPVLLSSARLKPSGDNPPFSVISVDSSSGSDFAGGEASCNSSRASGIFAGKERSNSRNGLSEEFTGVWKVERADFSRNRSVNEAEVSESSCVDSNSGVHERSRSLISKFRSGRESKNPKENDEVSEACTKSEITCAAEQNSVQNLNLNFKRSSEINRNDFVSVSSGVRATTSLEEDKNRGKENRAPSESEFSDGSRSHHAGDNCTDLIAQSILKHESDGSGADDSDLACSEQLRFSCCDDEESSEYCSSQEASFSDFHSEIYRDCSELELSDYTPSLFIDSGSQFSEGSVGETPSPTYSLCLQYLKEFYTLGSPVNASIIEDDNPHQFKFATFEDSDDEDSYQLLRKRERKQVYLWNYAEGYLSTTEFGELVLQQRSQMVHWIVEQSCRKQLRQETLFLGISLLDRFLSKGYFKDRRNLQILGIACLTLATRIEENQQYNRIGQKNFFIGNSVYSRCEVVAMEWVVQEVLEFKCFLPTIHSFLWFYMKAANADLVVEKRVKYLAVLALSAQEQLRYWPSTVAAALVILASPELNQNAAHKVIGIHVRSKDENLHECMESLEWLLRYL